MIDKRSGKIAYAVMSFGGLLGIGERYHPLPWATLKYDTRQGGYVAGINADQLKGAPTYGAPTKCQLGAIARRQSSNKTTITIRLFACWGA